MIQKEPRNLRGSLLYVGHMLFMQSQYEFRLSEIGSTVYSLIVEAAFPKV